MEISEAHSVVLAVVVVLPPPAPLDEMERGMTPMWRRWWPERMPSLSRDKNP